MTGSIADVPGIEVGHAEVPGGGSGCTVVLGPFRGRVDEKGLATGSRELDVLRGEHVVSRVDALLFTGGSAFGLAAAEGVVSWLEQEGRGHPTRHGLVPIVPAAVIFDLMPGRVRPGAAEGRRACEARSEQAGGEGRVGAGAGATVGKLRGPHDARPGGLGSVGGPWKTWTVGALAVVNAVGDVLDRTGRVVAGTGASHSYGGTEALGSATDALRPGENTTLAVVATDAPLGGDDLVRIARLASTALARRISPVHTPFDGDLTFALSTAETEEVWPLEHVAALGIAARNLLEDAIEAAVTEVGSKSSLRGT